MNKRTSFSVHIFKPPVSPHSAGESIKCANSQTFPFLYVETLVTLREIFQPFEETELTR